MTLCMVLAWSYYTNRNNIPQFRADLVTFTEKILNGKLYFLCSDIRKSRVIYVTQLAGGLLLKMLKYFEVMLNIFQSRLVFLNQFSSNHVS